MINEVWLGTSQGDIQYHLAAQICCIPDILCLKIYNLFIEFKNSHVFVANIFIY